MKKRTPVTVLQKIRDIVAAHRQFIDPERRPDTIFYFSDADPESDFYFSCSLQNAEGHFVIDYAPQSSSRVASKRELANEQEVVTKLGHWLGTLKAYDDTESVYDDQILKSYEAEFTSYFVMADEKADQKPFDLQKQFLLETYLRSVMLQLEAKKMGATEAQQQELDSLIEESETLSEDLTHLTQNQTVKGLAKLWARIRKFTNTAFVKEMLSEFRKQAAKALIEKGLGAQMPEWADWDTISGMIP